MHKLAQLVVLPLRLLGWVLRLFALGCQWTLWKALRVWPFTKGSLVDLVDGHGIIVYVGPNGSGKSLAAVDSFRATLEGIPWACDDVDHHHHKPFRQHAELCDVCEPTNFPDAGRCEVGWQLLEDHGYGERLAYSTLPLLDPQSGHPARLYRQLSDYRQLVAIEHADVLFDEVAGVSDAGDSASMPAQLKRWLQQLRKRDVRLRVTTPAYDRCSLPIRQVATLVVDARSFFVDTAFQGRLWRPRRAMIFEAFDGFEFRSFDKNSNQTQAVMARRYFWRPGCWAQDAYNTLAQVHALTEVSDAGMCGACGGTRSKPKCSCEPGVVDDLALGELRVVEEVSKAGARTRRAVPLELEPVVLEGETRARVAGTGGRASV